MFEKLIPIALAAGEATNAVGAVGDKAGSTVSETTAGLQGFIQTIWDQIPYFIAAIVVLIASYIVAKYARHATEKALLRSSQNPGALDLVGKSTQWGILTIGAVVSLQIMSIDLSLILGALGFGIGFALKDIIANYLSGIFILVQEPFKIGDLVEIEGSLGHVQTVEARNISIRSLDGQKITIANTDVFIKQVKNYSHYPERRVTLPIGVEYSSDLPAVFRIIQTTLQEHSFILDKPAPLITFTEFGESSINLDVRFWISSLENWLQIRSEVITQIKHEFDVNNINIPFPIRTLKTSPGEPVTMEAAQVKEFEHKKFKPTTVLSGKTKVSIAGATDSFDPQHPGHERITINDPLYEESDEPPSPQVESPQVESPQVEPSEKEPPKEEPPKEKPERQEQANTSPEGDIFDTQTKPVEHNEEQSEEEKGEMKKDEPPLFV